MAIGKIDKPVTQVIDNKLTAFTYTNKSVSARTTTEVYSFEFPESGMYLVLSFMTLNTSGTGNYAHTLASRTVRTTEDGGGGSVNYVHANKNAGDTMNVRIYTTMATTVSGGVILIRLT